MLFATVALVNSLTTTQVYRIIYQDLTPDAFYQKRFNGVRSKSANERCIMLIFDVLVILLLTRIINLPILQLWKNNRKLHCFVTAVVNLLIIWELMTAHT